MNSPTCPRPSQIGEQQQILDDEIKRTWKTDPIVLEDADRAISDAVN